MYKIIIFCFSMLLLVYTSTTFAAKLMDPIESKPQAEAFNLKAINGSSVSLNDFNGKFVLLNFWATWCAPCRKEMPSMNTLHNKLQERGFEVIGIHVGPSLAGVKKFLDTVPVDFTILIDKNMSLASWEVRGLPTTFLINPDGKIIYKATGEREWDSPKMIKFIEEIIASYGHMTKKKTPFRIRIESILANNKIY